MGNLFVDCDMRRGSHSIEGFAHEVRPIKRHTLGKGATGGDAAAGRDRDHIVEIEADHLRIDEVVAVSPNTCDSKTACQLGVSPHDNGIGVGPFHQPDVIRPAVGDRVRQGAGSVTGSFAGREVSVGQAAPCRHIELLGSSGRRYICCDECFGRHDTR